jgi:hypothetical protein
VIHYGRQCQELYKEPRLAQIRPMEAKLLVLRFTVACLFISSRVDFKGFLRSPDWFESDQWNSIYSIMHTCLSLAWNVIYGLWSDLNQSGLIVKLLKSTLCHNREAFHFKPGSALRGSMDCFTKVKPVLLSRN